MKEKEKLLTPKEVCQILKISRRTLYRLIKSRRIPGFKVGHEWRFRYGEVDKYLEGKIVLDARYFYATVLGKYQTSPDKYEIAEDKDKKSGWLKLTEAYRAVCSVKEYFPEIRFTYHEWKAGVKLVRLMPNSFNALSLGEVKHWLKFEVK